MNRLISSPNCYSNRDHWIKWPIRRTYIQEIFEGYSACPSARLPSVKDVDYIFVKGTHYAHFQFH
jgi:hypothetical protein